MRKAGLLLCVLSTSISVFLTACADKNEKLPMVSGTNYGKAVAVLHPTEGNSAHGVITFTKAADGVQMVADIEGLAPGKHGFHIHEFGDCTFADAMSAGGHFNPTGMPHGGPADEQRHIGDMGNLVADDSGKAHYEATDAMLTLNGPNSIIGRAVIVHAGEDDLMTQPTGNSGARVACGVIGIAKEESAE